MKEVIIEALESPKQSGKFKEPGLVRGVLYGVGIEKSTPVKFDSMVIRNLISNHGPNAKVQVKYKGSKKFGLVKEIQTEPISNKIIHIDIQIIAKDQKMQLQVPVHFIGEESLKKEQLELHVSKHEATITGDMNLMPEFIEVDVSNLSLGDQITYKDFNLNENLVTDDLDLVYGVVNRIRLVTIEEPEEGINSTEPALVGEEEKI